MSPFAESEYDGEELSSGIGQVMGGGSRRIALDDAGPFEVLNRRDAGRRLPVTSK